MIDKNSPQPPNTGIFGEANEQHDSGEKTQVVQQQQLASAQQGVESGLLHHVEPTPGEANEEADHGPKPDCEKTPSSSDETDWDAVAVFIAEATVADPTLARHQQVVKQESVPNSRRNQALSLSEEDRFLLCLSLGHSLRQAAAHVGVHHTTMVKRAKRDAEFAQAMALARQQARTDPLLAVRTASQKSWRAAAWLLEYLERRERRGRKKEKRSEARGQKGKC